MPAITNPRGRPITRGALSKRTGCNIETIRYYEQIGLMADPPRGDNGYRLYGEDHLKRLTFICRGRELGFGLGEIRGLLALVDGGDFSCAEVKKLTLDHVRDIRRKIDDLRKMEKVLKRMAAQCDDGDVPACPVVETLFREHGSPSSA